MRSADLLKTALPVGVATLALGGCVSTQTKNARLVLQNDRTLASENAIRVTQANPAVSVSSVQVIRSATGAALIVSIRNLAKHPVSDLPITVGVSERHRPAQYLNAAENLPYFDTHIAGIGGSASTLWVLTLTPDSARALTRGTVFARVGEAGLPMSAPSTHTTALPKVTTTATADGSEVEVSVNNTSGVPQTNLPVYAVATRDGRAVGAASGTVFTLNGGSSVRLALRMLGTTTGATVELAAPPTIFK